MFEKLFGFLSGKYAIGTEYDMDGNKTGQYMITEIVGEEFTVSYNTYLSYFDAILGLLFDEIEFAE